MPELRLGDQSEWVAVLQRHLTLHGFPVDDDGDFGPVTDAAVRAFQAANSLVVDGVVGTDTWAVLLGPVAPTTTVVATTTAPTTGPTSRPAIDLTVGIGPVQLGEVAETAIPKLIEFLGQPDRDETIVPGQHCADGTPWFRCACDPSAENEVRWDCLHAATELRIMTWDHLGLSLIFMDATVGVDDRQVTTPVQLWFWYIEQPATGQALTVEGFGPGMTVADIRQRPYAVFWYRLITTWPGTTETNLWAGGNYNVGVDWYGEDEEGRSWIVAEVQRALNAHGASLDVTGVIDATTLAAWDDFCSTNDLQCRWDEDTTFGGLMLGELGLPPPDARITYVMSSGGITLQY